MDIMARYARETASTQASIRSEPCAIRIILKKTGSILRLSD